MGELHSSVVAVTELSSADREAMFTLMDRVYAGVTRERFERDLAGKDECIVLRTESGELVGFSTQRFLTIGDAAGVFSGDTVIHPDHWGSPALFQAFARRYVADDNPPRWWFLICKGHRTYRLLPTFFQSFWPTRRGPTPDAAQALMDAYATALYPADYDPATGVLAYRHPTDRLRDGIAGVTERELRNPDVAFFVERNPGHVLGHDLVCLCELTPGNLRPRMRPTLLGQPEAAAR